MAKLYNTIFFLNMKINLFGSVTFSLLYFVNFCWRYLLICLEAPTLRGEEFSLQASISRLRIKRHSRNIEKNGWCVSRHKEVNEWFRTRWNNTVLFCLDNACRLAYLVRKISYRLMVCVYNVRKLFLPEHATVLFTNALYSCSPLHCCSWRWDRLTCLCSVLTGGSEPCVSALVWYLIHLNNNSKLLLNKPSNKLSMFNYIF